MNNNFSVITTSYNDEAYVEAFIENIIKQSLLPNEIIIVDGGSIDRTCSLVNKYSSNSPVKIKLVTKGRLNIAQAFNIGINISQTDFVLIVCMGNKFPITMCEDLYFAIKKNMTEASYGILMGIERNFFSKMYNDTFITKDGLAIMSNRCVMYDKKTFNKIGLFIEKFKYAGEDAEFLDRFNTACLTKTQINKITVYWETPDSWKTYKKQCKNYTIGELQYSTLKDCFFTMPMIRWYIIFTSILLFPITYYPLLMSSSLLSLGGLYYYYRYKSIKAVFMRESATLLRIMYAFMNIRYFMPSQRVNAIRFC